jgi:hypothetical protein
MNTPVHSIPHESRSFGISECRPEDSRHEFLEARRVAPRVGHRDGVAVVDERLEAVLHALALVVRLQDVDDAKVQHDVLCGVLINVSKLVIGGDAPVHRRKGGGVRTRVVISTPSTTLD